VFELIVVTTTSLFASTRGTYGPIAVPTRRQSVRCVERDGVDRRSGVPLNRRVEREGYFDCQYDTGRDHNWQVYDIGPVLNLYF
jgi:hypothetical protein